MSVEFLVFSTIQYQKNIKDKCMRAVNFFISETEVVGVMPVLPTERWLTKPHGQPLFQRRRGALPCLSQTRRGHQLQYTSIRTKPVLLKAPSQVFTRARRHDDNSPDRTGSNAINVNTVIFAIKSSKIYRPLSVFPSGTPRIPLHS